MSTEKPGRQTTCCSGTRISARQTRPTHDNLARAKHSLYLSDHVRCAPANEEWLSNRRAWNPADVQQDLEESRISSKYVVTANAIDRVVQISGVTGLDFMVGLEILSECPHPAGCHQC